jgi:hypothetical protein
MDIKEKFRKKLSREEIGQSPLTTSTASTSPDKAISKEDLKIILEEKGLEFPNSLIDFYGQAGALSLVWEIVDETFQNGKEREAVVRKNLWIKENYLDKGYSWEAVKILLSGNMNIPELKNILDNTTSKQRACNRRRRTSALKTGICAPSILMNLPWPA